MPMPFSKRRELTAEQQAARDQEILVEMRKQLAVIKGDVLPTDSPRATQRIKAKACERLIKLALSWKTDQKHHYRIPDENGITIMHEAAAAGLSDFFQEQYFSYNSDPATPKWRKRANGPGQYRDFFRHDKAGYTPLLYAALLGHANVCEELLNLGTCAFGSESGSLCSTKGENLIGALKFRYQQLVHSPGIRGVNPGKKFFEDPSAILKEIDRLQTENKDQISCSKEIPDSTLIESFGQFVKVLHQIERRERKASEGRTVLLGGKLDAEAWTVSQGVDSAPGLTVCAQTLHHSSNGNGVMNGNSTSAASCPPRVKVMTV